MNFNFLERFKPKSIEKTNEEIAEEIKPFVENFERGMLEVKAMLEISDKDSSQEVLTKIESHIMDMRSNLDKITKYLKSTKTGEEYFLIEEREERDSLLKVQQDIILENTPFSGYPLMVSDLKSFEKEAQQKLVPNISEIDSYHTE